MNKTLLQFPSLAELAAFIESAQLRNYEINRNTFMLCLEIGNDLIHSAIHDFHATAVQQQILTK